MEDRPEELERAAYEFFLAFSKFRDIAIKRGIIIGPIVVDKGFKSRPCPQGNPKQLCKDINDWAKEFLKWAEVVHCTLWPQGMSDPPDPPPPPPFLDE